jgi:hypothetical protein
VERIADAPRKTYRNLRKSAGLPASSDVGVLGTQLRAIIGALESTIDIKITEAAVSIPHLSALYMDDIQDACEYIDLQNIELPNYWQPLIWESASAFAGYKIGLCEHYKSRPECSKEQKRMRKWNAFIVHYSRGALITSLNPMAHPYENFEPEYRHSENFTLGYDSPARTSHEERYWKAVYRELREIIEHRDMNFGEPDMVVVTGDKADDKRFLKVLESAVMKNEPIVFRNDTVFAPAKGTAELVMRGRYMRLPEANFNSERKDMKWIVDL